MVVNTIKMLFQTFSMTGQSTFHLSEEQIMAEVVQIQEAQQDPRKFEPLYKKYYPRVLAFIYQRVDNKDQAYDITAQTFYTALDKLKIYRNLGLPFSAWLFRISINELNKFYKKNKAERTINIDSEGAQALQIELENTVDEETYAALFKALQYLEPEEMQLIEFRFFERRSFKEICDITGLGESAVKMRVYRVFERLKFKLKGTKA
jgi:RNA polymerase sigma-70 factor (ECF subfamily)